jgi:hypothetical protein
MAITHFRQAAALGDRVAHARLAALHAAALADAEADVDAFLRAFQALDGLDEAEQPAVGAALAARYGSLAAARAELARRLADRRPDWALRHYHAAFRDETAPPAVRAAAGRALAAMLDADPARAVQLADRRGCIVGAAPTAAGIRAEAAALAPGDGAPPDGAAPALGGAVGTPAGPGDAPALPRPPFLPAPPP